jgi:hypothetical protein
MVTSHPDDTQNIWSATKNSTFPQIQSQTIRMSEDFRSNQSSWQEILAKFDEALGKASSEGTSQASIEEHQSRQILGERRLYFCTFDSES